MNNNQRYQRVNRLYIHLGEELEKEYSSILREAQLSFMETGEYRKAEMVAGLSAALWKGLKLQEKREYQRNRKLQKAKENKLK